MLTAGKSDAAVVTIRVHDYAQLPTESIARAQHRVTDIFGGIGVETQWLRTARPWQALEIGPPPVYALNELVVIVLSPDMARRRSIASNVVGTAIVTPDDRGRIAYVLFDRVSQVAKASAANPMDVMGIVIAHELGHLILPHGAHSRTGLMRPKWTIQDLRVSSRFQFYFTTRQGEMIRRRLEGESPASFANATR